MIWNHQITFYITLLYWYSISTLDGLFNTKVIIFFLLTLALNNQTKVHMLYKEVNQTNQI